MAKLAQLSKAYDAGRRAQLVPAYEAPSGAPAFSSPADRGTLQLASCSYADNLFTLKSYWDKTGGSSGARSLYAQIDNVNGMTPQFQLVRSELDIMLANSHKFVFSYDGINWIPFTNRGSNSTHYLFSHESPFTSSRVFVALWPAWQTGRTLPWIQSLQGSGYVSDTASSSGHVFGTRTATADETGRSISATDLYAFKISTPGVAPDGNAKRKMVLMSGVHASEDIGNYILKGAVEFILSEDPQAQRIRSWFDVLVYPLVASAGRKGGSARGDFQTGYIRSNINREWLTNNFETLTKHKAAILADTGGTAKVFFDFHGAPSSGYPYNNYRSGTDFDTWRTAIQTYIPGLAQELLVENGYSLDWAEVALSPDITITPEMPMGIAYTTPAQAEAYGVNHMRAVALLAEQEYFGIDNGITGTVTIVESGYDTVRATATLVDVQATVPPTGVLNFVGHVPMVTTGVVEEELSDVVILINSHVAKKTYVGDTGSSLLVDFGMDISDASEYHIEVKKPDGTQLVWPARIVGTNHIAFNTLPDTFDQAGIWKLQAKVKLPNGKWSGKTADLQVWPAFR